MELGSSIIEEMPAVYRGPVKKPEIPATSRETPDDVIIGDGMTAVAYALRS